MVLQTHTITHCLKITAINTMRPVKVHQIGAIGLGNQLSAHAFELALRPLGRN